MPEVLLSREPLVNRQNKIIATRVCCDALDGAVMSDVAKALCDLTDFWPASDKPLFVAFRNTTIDESLFGWGVPENVVLELPGGLFSGDESASFREKLNTQQCSFCLQFDADAKAALMSGVKFRFVGFDATKISVAQMKPLIAQTQSFGIGVALGAQDHAVFQSLLEAGATAVSTWAFQSPASGKAKSLNPSQAQIIQLLNLVRNNADVREIEAALKKDVTLSYKLLRYINSAGFGLSCEIQSFRHAVTILGYSKLNKWLSLLLATASKDPMASALMHTALVRARLMELLAHDLVDSQEYDNLFITGAFSMLEPLLGVDMATILESMTLPDAIHDALLGQGGMYSPFLDVAKQSEHGGAEALSQQLMMLSLTPKQYNQALIQALVFAETMSL